MYRLWFFLAVVTCLLPAPGELGAEMHGRAHLSVLVKPFAQDNGDIARAAAMVAPGVLWVSTTAGNTYEIDLIKGGWRVIATPPLLALAATKKAIWGIPEGERSVIQLDFSGGVINRIKTPFLPTELAAFESGTLIASCVPKHRGDPIMWRFHEGGWSAWALPEGLRGASDQFSRYLVNTLRLDGNQEMVAAVFPLLRSEILVFSDSGEESFRISLPYFAEKWAPLGETTFSFQTDSISEVPKPYADVVLFPDRAYCLSFQEGPWQNAKDTDRGRHLVEVTLDKQERIGVLTLEVKGVQIVREGNRLLVVDRQLGVWEVQWPKD